MQLISICTHAQPTAHVRRVRPKNYTGTYVHVYCTCPRSYIHTLLYGREHLTYATLPAPLLTISRKFIYYMISLSRYYSQVLRECKLGFSRIHTGTPALTFAREQDETHLGFQLPLTVFHTQHYLRHCSQPGRFYLLYDLSLSLLLTSFASKKTSAPRPRPRNPLPHPQPQHKQQQQQQPQQQLLLQPTPLQPQLHTRILRTPQLKT